MSDILVKSVAGILVVSITIGVLASLLVVVVSVADTRPGRSLLNTRAGKGLLRLPPVRSLVVWLVYKQFWDKLFAADFAQMAQDRPYQEEGRRLAGEFATADWQAFQIVVEQSE
jgi:hypothetical protein